MTARVVGLLADPDTPAEIAARLVDELPGALSDEVGGEWDVRMADDPVTASITGPDEVLDAVADRAGQDGWEVALYLTDLPLRRDGRPVLGELDRARHVGGLSLPALGLFVRHRAVLRVATRLLGELAASDTAGRDGDRRRTVTARGGRLRLLAGMVRSNRPWRLLTGMRSALAAIIATSAYLIITTTIWQLATTLSVVKLAITTVAAVAAMVGWIIGTHGLWEHPRDRGEREETALYNACTVLTLTAGVLTMVGTVFVFNLVVTFFFLEAPIFSSGLGHQPAASDYLRLAWLASGFATVAGALGSGLDSDDAVRRAAYGYREREQRRQMGQDQGGDTHADDADSADSDSDPERDSSSGDRRTA